MEFTLSPDKNAHIACDYVVMGSMHTINKHLPLGEYMITDTQLIIGTGEAKALSEYQYITLLEKLWAYLQSMPAKTIVFQLGSITVLGRDTTWNMQQIVLSATQAFYHYIPQKKSTLKHIQFIISNKHYARAKKMLAQVLAIREGMLLAKQLGDKPANQCTPRHLAQQARLLEKKYDAITAEVLNEKTMKTLGMGALLAVSQGSKEPAKCIIMHYQGTKTAQRPIALIGKGITFDSGGITLKSPPAMDEMKYDMLGGATVLGCFKAAAIAQLPLSLVGIIPATENLPNGCAYKPGDVISSLSGKTIEILSTDAEGRLILCDALTYCARFNPRFVIDIATLTGAMLNTFGRYINGFFSNDDILSDALLHAGQHIHDPCWRLPIETEYASELHSHFADIANIGSSPYGGALKAAYFLSQFTEKYRWAHLDIAGTAWENTPNNKATGRPIPLLMQFLFEMATD